MNPFTCSYNSKYWRGERWDRMWRWVGLGWALQPSSLSGAPSSDCELCSGLRTTPASPWCSHALRRPLSTTGQVQPQPGGHQATSGLVDALTFFNRASPRHSWKPGGLSWMPPSSLPEPSSQLGNIFLPPLSHSLVKPPPQAMRPLSAPWSLLSSTHFNPPSLPHSPPSLPSPLKNQSLIREGSDKQSHWNGNDRQSFVYHIRGTRLILIRSACRILL